jgi:hypothetical protein
MKPIKQAVRLLLVAALACMMLTAVAFAETDGSVWLSPEGTTVQIVTDAAVTDGVVELTYDSSAMTYQGVETVSNVAQYAVNADEDGVVRISWVAPGAYEADEAGTVLINVLFDGSVTEDNVSLSGTANDANGADVPVGEKPADTTEVDTSALEAAIAKAEGLDSSKYTEDSFAALEKALAEAKAVLADPNATQEQVDAATKALNDAIAALVPVSDTAASNTTGTTAAKTGDSSYIGLAIGLGVLACAGLAVGVVVNQKRRGTR